MFSIPAIAGVSLFFLVVYKYILYPVLLSPLSKIPNAHPTSALSSLWILLNRFNQRENSTVHAAHLKYGPVVRLAPDEISINCVDGGTRTVYGGGFDRHEWYGNLFANYGGTTNLVSIIPSKPHSARKRMLSNIYSKTYLFSSTPLQAISQTIIYDRLLPLIQSAGNSKTIDVPDLFYSVNMDFMTAYLFGLTNSTNFLQDETTRRHWLAIYQSRKPYAFWYPELPNLTAWLAKLGIRVVPRQFATATKEIETWCLSMCDAAERTLATQSPTSPPDPTAEPVVYKQLKHGLENDRTNPQPPPSTRLLLASEMLDATIAGFETSGVTLTYLTYALSLRPDLQSALRAELLSLDPQLLYPSHDGPTPTLPAAKAIDALPLLHAVIMETLRRYPPVPIGQPRRAPASGTTTLGPFAGIPPGTRVNAQAYSLHRNADVFPEPEEWRPERWMEKVGAEKDEGRDEKSRWFWAFGSGGRMCVGSNFAIHGMKATVAAIYSNYRTSVVDDAGIEPLEGFIAGPKGGKLLLKFEHV